MTALATRFNELAGLARSGESATVEFKKPTAETDRACRTPFAFASGRGGRFLFGITPAGKLVGQQVPECARLIERVIPNMDTGSKRQ